MIEPKLMVKAYLLGGSLAAIFIIAFSLLGVYGNMAYTLDPEHATVNMQTGDPAATTKYLGSAFFSVVNVIFITSSIATVDSTFSCTAKVVGPELTEFFNSGKPAILSQATTFHMWIGRASVALMAVVGILPLLHHNIKALSATTQTGTILMGLGPPLLFLPDIEGYRPLCFHIPFWLGACLGVVYSMRDLNNDINTSRLVFIEDLAIGTGHYNVLLGVNVLGACLVMGVRIIISYHHPVSSSRIIISYHHYHHIIISYHHLVSSSHIIIPYHHPVSSHTTSP